MQHRTLKCFKFVSYAAMIGTYLLCNSADVRAKGGGGYVLQAAGGALIGDAASNTAQLAMTNMGLGSVVDVLFPSPDEIDYEKIAEIVGSQVRKENLAQTVREQADLTKGVALTMFRLKNRWKAEVDGNNNNAAAANKEIAGEMSAALARLEAILGAVSGPEIASDGLGAYLIAAQMKITIETFLWKAVPGNEFGDKAQLVGDINSMKKHMTDLLPRLEEEFYDSIKCTEYADWWEAKVPNGPLASKTLSGNDCNHTRMTTHFIIQNNQEKDLICEKRGSKWLLGPEGLGGEPPITFVGTFNSGNDCATRKVEWIDKVAPEVRELATKQVQYISLVTKEWDKIK